MKWNELSLAERKQIYQNAKTANPNITYFDVKERYNSIPEYEEGGKSVKYNTPEYTKAYNNNQIANSYDSTTGDYYKSLPQVIVTPKNNLNLGAVSARGANQFASDYALPLAKTAGAFTPIGPVIGLADAYDSYSKGDNFGAILGAGLEILPFGLNKVFGRNSRNIAKIAKLSAKDPKKVAGKLSQTGGINLSIGNVTENQAYNLVPVGKTNNPMLTGWKRAQARSGIIDNYKKSISKYDKEISDVSRDMMDALYGKNDNRYSFIEQIDQEYDTNYKKIYNDLLRDILGNRGKIIDYKTPKKLRKIHYTDELEDLGVVTEADPKRLFDKRNRNPRYSTVPSDYKISINVNEPYSVGTANHEIGHFADLLETQALLKDQRYITNKYLDYLSDPKNLYSFQEAYERFPKYQGKTVDASKYRDRVYDYLTMPTETKAHMVSIKRGMLKDGIINNWDDNVTLKDITNYFKRHGDGGIGTESVFTKELFNLFKDKNAFVERMNKLAPASIVPLGYAAYDYETKNKK